jgi:EpsI family protein
MQHQFVLRDHSALGWGLFGFWILMFLLIASRLVGPPEISAAATARAARNPMAGNRVGSASILLTLGALALGPVLVYAYQSDRSGRGGESLHIPAEIGGWRGTPALRGDFRPVFLVPDLEYERIYRDDQGREVYLYVAEYAIQEQGKEAVSNANTVYDERAWQPVATRARQLANSIAVQETRLRSRANAEKLVWQWYYVHGYAVRSPHLAKVLGAWSTLSMDPASAVVIVATDVHSSGKDSESSLLRFVTDSRPAIERAIDRARQRELSP